jgi:hypothetical protein
MTCRDTEMKTFIDWSQQHPKNFLEPVIHVFFRGQTPGDEASPIQTNFLGDLTYFPLWIMPTPPRPGQPARDLHSFFYGNLYDDRATHVVIYIVLSQNIVISLQAMEGSNPGARAVFNNISCSASGNSLSIETDAGGTITLRKAWHLHVPLMRSIG